MTAAAAGAAGGTCSESDTALSADESNSNAPGTAGTAGAAITATTAGKKVANELLVLSCRLSATHWQPSSVLTCAAWTLLAACLPQQTTLEQSMQQTDLQKLDLTLHALQRCSLEAPPAPALWPDTTLWWYLLTSAQVLTHGRAFSAHVTCSQAACSFQCRPPVCHCSDGARVDGRMQACGAASHSLRL